MNPIKRNPILLSLLLLTFSSIYFTSCKKESDEEQASGTEQTATISGKVHTPSGKVVGNALVKVSSKSTHTNSKGEFSLLIPAGNQTVIIQTGSGKLFKRVISVNLTANQNYKIPDNQTVLSQTGNMAFIIGTYDQIETIIIDTLGYTATPITVNDLHSAATLANYQALFFNCTDLDMEPNLDSVAYSNLGGFLADGGSIYASDFAVEYLTGNGFWKIMSGAQNNYKHLIPNGKVQTTCLTPKIGGFIPDSSLCTSKSGISGMVPHVDIVDPGLITALGKDSMDIYYDLGSWEVVSVDDAPFTRIMEKTGSYPFGAVALKTSFPEPSGNIYFTTFHNHPQSFVSSDVMVVLQYFILNL